MARYCIAFESMKRFMTLKGNEGLAELVRLCSLMVGEWVTLLWTTYRWVRWLCVVSLRMSI